MHLKNNVVLITGGASGIGFAIAKKMASENTVIIAGRNEEKLRTAVKERDHCDYVVCDISNQQHIEKLSMYLQQKYPAFNVLINNAGIQHNYYLQSETSPYKKIEDEIAVNFTGAVKLSALLMPQLTLQKEAVIVNVTSSLALAPKENAAVYCATKAALRSFSKALRYQCEKTSVNVIELVPPLVDTAMTKGRGVNKISADDVADAFIKGLQLDRKEIWVGKAKLVKVLHKIAPSFMEKKMRGSM